MQLETKRVIIRPFTLSDLLDVNEYCAQPEIGVNAGWCAHESVEETAGILNGWILDGYKHAIVLKQNGKVIGHIGIDPDSEENRCDTRELGCALNRNYHRRGIMTEAVRATVDKLFAADEIQFVWACCFQSNAPSKNMIEKCGFLFVKEGTFDAVSLGKQFLTYEYRISRDEWSTQGGA